jgi:hypothetical protein
MAETRQCDKCSRVLPLDKKHFPHVPGGSHSFQKVCKKCKLRIRRDKHLDKLEGKAVDQFIARSISGGSNIPHTAELLESLMSYFGGANGFASIVLKQYFESPPGGRIRNSIIEMVTRLAAKNTEQGGAKKPIQMYSEDELEAEINKRLEQAVLVYGGKRYLNATAEDAATFAGLPASDGPEHLVVPAGRTEDAASRVEREANRSLEAIQAHAAPVGVSPVQVERDAGDRGESVG